MESESFILATISFLCFIALTAFFSAAKSSLLYLSVLKSDQIENLPDEVANRFIDIKKNTKDLLLAILFGLAASRIGAAAVAVVWTDHIVLTFSASWILLLTINLLLVFAILLLIGEIIPRAIVAKNPLKMTMYLSRFVLAYRFVCRPLVRFYGFISSVIYSQFRLSTEDFSLREEELLTLVEVEEEHGGLHQDERAMIHSIIGFANTQVKEIMVPRIDMFCVEKDTSIPNVIDLIKQKGHTRVPIFDKKIDSILGVLHAKDLLPYLKDNGAECDLADLVRPIVFVPESKPIDTLLKEFQRQQQHMAIVVDEYGGTAGLVTLEDILEEIVGEIQDEYDREAPLCKKLAKNSYLINAKIDIHDLNRELGIELPTESDFESLGGFILSLTGAVPREKEVIKHDKYRFTVEKIERNRIVQVKLEIIENSSKAENVAAAV